VLQADGISVRLYTSALFIEGRAYVIRAHDVLDPYGNAVPPSSERTFTALDRMAPRLLGAQAPNDRYLTVIFNEAMNPVTAENAGNYRVYYSIDPENPENDNPCCSPSAAALIDTGTVRLSFLLSPMPMRFRLVIRASNVTDLAGNVVSANHNTAFFDVPDQYPPKIRFVQMPDTNVIEVWFDEAVSDSTASAVEHYEVYERDDTLSTIPVSGAALLSQITARLTLGAPLEPQTIYILRVHGVRDLSGNLMAPPGTIEFKPSDYFPPVPLSARALSHTLIRILFNKQLEETSAETALYYRVFETLNETATIPVGGATLEASGDAVLLDLDAWIPYTASFTVSIMGVRDLDGRTMANASLVVSYPDSIPPGIIGVALLGGSSFELLFNDYLDAVSAGEESNYRLYETADSTHTIPIFAAALAGDGSRVLLTLSGGLMHGRSYTISVSNVADVYGIVIPPGTAYVFTFVDTTVPALLSAHAASDTSVCAYFSEPLDNMTAENPGTYSIVEQADSWHTVPVSSAALIGDSSSVQLSLGGTLTAGIIYKLNATGVTDRAGNLLPAGSTALFSIPDTVPPGIQFVRQESFELVYLAYNEPVEAAGAGNPGNYSLVGITQPPDTTAPSAVARLGDKLVSLAFAPPFAPGRIFAVQARNIVDRAGNVIPPGSEKRFVSSPYPAGGGIGLYIDKDHSMNDVRYGLGDTEFRMYVWCKPGAYGATRVEFNVPWTGHVYPGATTVNTSVVAVSSGEPFSGMTATLSQCATDWVWICREQCYLIDSEVSTLDISPAGSSYPPMFTTCAEGNPQERANVISPIRCNYVEIATLLAGFTASYREGAIDIAWSLSRLDGEARFSVSRAAEGMGEFTPLAGEISGSGLSYSYLDETAEPGETYRYRVAFIDAAGAHDLFDTEPVAVPALPLTLYQNWPNPFNPSTNVGYYLPAGADVRLEIFDVAGHRVTCLVNGRREKGKHDITWNGADEAGRAVAAGIYISRLTADRETLSRKMILLR